MRKSKYSEDEITPEMLDAGAIEALAVVAWPSGAVPSEAHGLALRVYSAMRAAAPERQQQEVQGREA